MKKDISKNKKKYIINAAVILVVTALAVFYLFHNNTFNAENLSKVGVLQIVLPLITVAICTLICAFLCYMVYHPMLKNWKFTDAIGEGLYGNLGSKITPYKTGHFPFRVYFQGKRGVKFYQSLTGLTKTQLVYSFSSVFLYGAITVALLIKGYSVVIMGINIPFWAVYGVGFLFHLVSITVCILLAFNQPIQNFVINILSKIIYRFKKTGNAEEFKRSEKLKMRVYKEQVKDMVKHIGYYLPLGAVYILQMFIFGSLPYICYLSVSGSAFNFYDYFYFYMLFITMTYANNVLPIPGGSGSAEILFNTVFSVAISGTYLGATLICWRLSTFYISIIAEFIYFIVSINLHKKRYADDAILIEEKLREQNEDNFGK